MKHGTIVQNMWQPSHKSYLVYLGTSGDYANCLWIIDGKLSDEIHKFYKRDILNDREHFPIGGKTCAIQIFRECLCADSYINPKIQESRAIGQIMNKMPGWEKCSTYRTEKYGKQKGWIKAASDQADTADDLPF